MSPSGSSTVERLSAALADRYRIERKLGAGGMATVYLAHDQKHQRDVAIKVLRPELARSLTGDRFLREIAITARLDHPHILALLDSGSAEGGEFLYYVMPVATGQSLRDRLDRSGALPVAGAVRIAADAIRRSAKVATPAPATALAEPSNVAPAAPPDSAMATVPVKLVTNAPALVRASTRGGGEVLSLQPPAATSAGTTTTA